MADIGYVRVSSIGQNTDRQLDGIKLKKVFTDKLSGKNTYRPQLMACIEYLREGDVLHVHSMDRLSRRLTDLEGLVRDLTEKGIAIKFHKENLLFAAGEDVSPMNNLLFQVMAAFAQFERANLKERQMEGIAKAPIIDAYRAGKKKSEIVREFGISRSYLYKVLGDAKATAADQRAADPLRKASPTDRPKEVATSEFDKATSGKRPYPNRQPVLQFEDEADIIKSSTASNINIFADQPDFNDTDAYRLWIDSILISLSDDDLSHQEICIEMMERGIKTPKGKEKWFSIGVRGLLNHIKLKQQEAADTSLEFESDSDPEANAPKAPTWEDDGYREYTRDMIFQFREEGMTLNQIVDELTKIGAKTRTGKDRWNIGTVSMILRNEKDL